VPAETAPPVTEAPAPVTYAVAAVMDGDTLDVVASDGGAFRVRLIGIDAPESGACEGPAATNAMVRMVQGRTVTLTMGGDGEDTDNYGRFLRYVDVGGVDVGQAMIEVGLATARFDSRDGYGRHDREDSYVAADAARANYACPPPPTAPPAPAPTPVPAPTTPNRQPQPQPEPGDNVFYANCDAVRAAGADPIYPGDPGWQQKFDRDKDGVGCE
jgi:endonuclease YncB( thermonuclease family)